LNNKTLESPSIIQNLSTYSNSFQTVDILRIDTIHPIVSGNKWFKLRYYLKDCIEKKYNTIASFGGPYSNHIVALAFAAKENKLQSIGYIRTNEGEPLTHTLMEAQSYGMQLVFLGRTLFQQRKEALLHETSNSTYFVDEGGYGILGMKGAADILNDYPETKQYDQILCAVGTGTMIAGICHASAKNQQILGIPVLKNEASIATEINALLPENKKDCFTLIHDYHFGGYAKKNEELLSFMQSIWLKEKLPTDFVYTGKLLYAVNDLIQKQYFKSNAKILLIHSGGLQGNKSLYTNTHSNTSSNAAFNFDFTSS
jgi:1-aminocyclopropane-1-carboxylate deaminase